jgi:hypothetical protein
MKYLPLFHHFKAIYQFPKHIILLVKFVANASLNVVALCCPKRTGSGPADLSLYLKALV